MFTVTEPAAARINDLLTKEAPGMSLRVQVTPGGCSGFRYEMFFDTDVADDDVVIRAPHGVQVLLDSASAPLLDGATIDFQDSLTDAGFKIENPNAKRSCGCGKSFS